MIYSTVSNIIWRRNSENHAMITDLSFEDGFLVIEIKIGLTEDYVNSSSESVVIVKGRSSSIKHIFKIEINESLELSRFGRVKVPVDIFENSEVKIWDFYVKLDPDKKQNTLRLEEFLTNITEIVDYVLNRKTRIKPYSTVNGNFSIKAIHNNISVRLINLDTSKENSLNLKGEITGLDEENLDYHLVFHKPNKDSEYKVEFLVNYTNKGMVFEKDINLDDVFFDLNEQEYMLYIEVIGKDYYEKVPFTDYGKPISYSNKPFVNVNSVLFKLDISPKTKKKIISVYFSKQEYIADVQQVIVLEDKFTIKGEVISENNPTVDGKYKVIAKRREGFGEIVEEIQIKNNKFNYSLDTKEFIRNKTLFNGIWDLYLEVNGQLYRFTSYLDDISNKRSIIRFPQLNLENTDKELKSVKPYYTLYNGLSLLVRNHISGTRIKYLYFDSMHVEIKGLMNIQVPNDNIPNELFGNLEAKFPFGEKLKLPFKIMLSKTNKKKALEFEYLLHINMDEKTKKKFYKYINFDLLKFAIEFPIGTSTLYLNILPTMIVNNSEKTIRAYPKLSKIFNKLKMKLYYVMNKTLPINRKMVIFQSTTGMNYSDNPRAIYEEMVYRQYDMNAVWVVNKMPSKIDGNPKIVKPNTLKYYYYMAIGKYFINNGNFPNFYEKRSGAVHIQTWHGTPLKKLGFDIDPSSPSYKENTSKQLIRRNKRWDYLVAPNEYTGEILQRAYLFENKMLNVGYPRNDIFYKSDEYKFEKIKQTKEYLNVPSNKKVILYAPTWRDSEFHAGQANEPYDFKFRLEKFAENFGDEYVLLIRLHPREAVRCQISDLEGIVYNVSNYDDIKHLYLITDILITDYSSVMFDFVNTKRPIVFFTHDIDQYSSTLRGFYFDLQKDAPGPLVKSESELFSTIKNIDFIYEEFKVKYEAFYKKFCSWEDGSASKRVLDSTMSDLEKGVK